MGFAAIRDRAVRAARLDRAGVGGQAMAAGAAVLVGVLLLTAGAKAQVPMWPVPMTLQTLAVLLIGAGFGARLGAASVAAYLALGIAGLPVFAGPIAGPAYLLGPTGGYLIGFVLAAAAIGALVAHNASQTRLALALAVGSVIPMVTGWAWLSTLTGDPAAALAAGVTPFLAGMLVKFGLAWALLAGLGRVGQGR